jgi:hypothetical protein
MSRADYELEVSSVVCQLKDLEKKNLELQNEGHSKD